MANQYTLTKIDEGLRNAIVSDYKTGIGVDSLIKSYPYGRDIIRRILREAKVPRMSAGSQIKFKAEQGYKTCCHCGKEKPFSEFSIQRKRTKDGYRSQCRECRSKLERKNSIKRQYGISLAEYDKMYQAQHGLCACCGQPELSRRRNNLRSLSVDHDHVTGQVRQLLCHRCNLVVGLVNENPDMCELLRAYILKHKERKG